MKAAVCTMYGSPEVLQIIELAKPIPKKNQISIKVHAGSVTASDCIIRGFKVTGIYRILMPIAIGFIRPRKPILGMVFAGEVESVGKNATRFEKGDRVFGFDRFGFGSDAEYKCISVNHLVAKMTSNVTYEEAASIPFGGLMALHYLKKSGIRQGQKLLVYGSSGAIGAATVQLAKYFGAHVTGVCSTANVELIKSLGADEVIDYTKENFMNRRILYDVILNAVGKKKVELRPEDVLNKNGKYITVDDGTPKLSVQDLTLLNHLMETGQIKAVIDRCYPLEQIADAHRYVDKGHKKGNVIITIV
jgi:NADPH:quinone reductase-like Zn-dependent oxidoreductase